MLKDPLGERNKREWVGDLKELAWIIDGLAGEKKGPDEIAERIISAYLRGRGLKTSPSRAWESVQILNQLLELCQSPKERKTHVDWENTQKALRLFIWKAVHFGGEFLKSKVEKKGKF